MVPSNMERFEAGLLREHTPCCPAELLMVAGRIAEVHAELLLIHPFREGNGRLARWLADLMALQAGYGAPLYGFRGRGGRGNQARYLEAVKRGYLQDYAALSAFFREAVERRRERSG
jgi:cell filamentation protein